MDHDLDGKILNA